MKEFLKELPEDLQDNKSLNQYDSFEALAKSHINLNQILSQKIEGLAKDDSFETFSSKAEKFNHISNRDEYDKQIEADDSVKELGFKYKIHPQFQLKGFLEEYTENIKKLEDEVKNDQINNWENQNKELFKDVNDKDMVLAKAYKVLGTDSEKFNSELGDLKNHPKINEMLIKLGSFNEKEKSKVILPSEKETLETQDKISFLNEHLNNPSSPLYNPKHADHLKINSKVKEYTKYLAEKETKTGKKYGEQLSLF